MNNKLQHLLRGICLTATLIAIKPSTIYAATTYAGGSGTQDDPYLISTPEQLNLLQEEVNIQRVNTQGIYYELTNDIDLSGFDSDNDPSNGNWTPIGGLNGYMPFKGHFNGNGYTIKNMRINLPQSNNLGLFGQTIYAFINDINLESTSITGNESVGSLIGHADYTIIERVSSSIGSISGQNRTGGLIGAAYSVTLSQVTASLNVDGKTTTGGLVGYTSQGTLKDSYFSGMVRGTEAVGGLIGHDYGMTIQRLYASAPVSGASRVGALIGYQEGTYVTLSNSYWNENPAWGLDSVGYSRGGIQNTTSNIVRLSSPQMYGDQAKLHMTAFDFDKVWATKEWQGPILQWQIKNEAPIITAQDVEILEGDVFEALNYASATDPEEGDLPVIVVRDTVNPDVPGIYEVEYSASDSKGATTTKVIQVTVKKRLVVLNSAPVIQAENLTIKEGELIDLLDGVTATDVEDGPLIATLISSDLNANVPGQYTATFEATDSQGATTTKTITITVLKRIIPVIEAEDVYLFQGEIFNPLDHVTATDEKDPVLTIDVIKNTVDTSKVGTYQVTYQVINSEGEKAVKTIQVIVEAKRPEPTLPDKDSDILEEEKEPIQKPDKDPDILEEEKEPIQKPDKDPDILEEEKEPVITGLSTVGALVLGGATSGIGIFNLIMDSKKLKRKH